ncbi:MAG: peptide deformylase [Rickettsiales bacterium]|jgi:peptide deformylase|nr:peptide deformylase [Rickettsiales bacterium]
MILKILTINDKILKQKSVDILEDNSDDIKKLADDMLETMYSASGVGLAGVQIGILKRIIVIDVKQKEGKTEEEKIKSRSPIILLNPMIIWKSDEKELMSEGCLSVPEERAEVMRHKEIEIEYCDLEFKRHKIKADGFFAQALQHEIDHLNGIIYTDHLSKIKRDMIVKKIKKFY